ncbi:MAG: hypothetical protein QOC77_3872 [Thermoleophilaceae bacterium]|jgi:hypothetical protein|nr:hypothetical protein [Thermoleophilaceae bacterium]
MGLMARFRRGLVRRRAPAPAPNPPLATPLRGLGEPPATPTDAGEAELDTLRGELVRELDRMAEGDDGSGSFRRIAS